MTNKERYLQFAAGRADLPLWLRPWWLDAVSAGRRWDVLLVTDGADNLQAVMPYTAGKRLFMTYVSQPLLTGWQGAWILPEVQDSVETMHHVAEELSRQLQELGIAYYTQAYRPDSLLPALLKPLGFGLKERRALTVDTSRPLDSLLAAFAKGKREELQQALTLTVSREMNPEDFWRFCQQANDTGGSRLACTREFFLVIYQKAMREGCGEMLRAVDAEGHTLSAVFLLRDSEALYYWLPVSLPRTRDNGAASLLVWEAVKLARQLDLPLDFCHPASRRMAAGLRRYGAKQTAQYIVSRSYKPFFRFLRLFGRL
ncbi:MAG: GNAT family N-acetyltransferase [Paludibacteraceae bacterium]|nr:GNAT family N-acetyltransferase [Paludibacteraceae bacterium]